MKSFNQSGFLLPAAIFLLVTLAGLGAFAVNIHAIQQSTGTQDIQGTRAYHAARGGIEWAAYQIIQPTTPNTLPGCPADTTLTLGTFNVTVTCNNAGYSYTEDGGDKAIKVYEIGSIASFGTVQSQNYIERRLDLTISKCITGSGATALNCE